MRKSTWHLRMAVTSTAALMSVATALIIPQLETPTRLMPEISVPYHATAPQSTIDSACAEFGSQPGMALDSLSSQVPVQVEIYSRDAASALPEVQLDTVRRNNCIHFKSASIPQNTLTDSTRDTLTKAICDQADSVALKIE